VAWERGSVTFLPDLLLRYGRDSSEGSDVTG
jgi:hypothetical protein